MINDAQRVQDMYLAHPAQYAQMLGYSKMRDDLHGMWIEHMVMRQHDQTLLAHRGSYKTTCLAVAIAILMQVCGDKSIMFLRKTDNDVAEVLRNVARILQHPVTQSCYLSMMGKPLVIAKETFSEITTSAYTAPRGASQVVGVGIGGSLTGKHADIIITDDIVNRADRVSRAERERTRAAYMELQNILIPGGRFINTGTPWHPQDAFLLMPEAERYDCYQTGMLDNAQIDHLRQSMEPSLFAANYELRHIPSGAALFGQARPITDDVGVLRDGIAHLDAAFGGGDYTAFTCASRIGDTIYLYGRLWRSHVDTVMDTVVNECERLMCAPLYSETNPDKGYVSRELRQRGLPTRPYNEKQNKYSKIATHLRKWWSKIVFVRGTDAEYIRQIMAYNEAAEHDDAPDSAACCCRVLDRRGDA